MKKLFSIILLGFFICISLNSNASANIVTINLEGVAADGINIGGFQLLFYAPDGSYQYPLSLDADFNSDFSIDWASPPQANPAGWYYADSYPFTSVGDSDFATGYAAVPVNDTNVNLALNDGPIVTLSSVAYFFGINPADSNNAFFEFFSGAEIAGLQISEEWQDTDQIITISQVPIPPAILLLGGGLVGLVGLRRKVKN